MRRIDLTYLRKTIEKLISHIIFETTERLFLLLIEEGEIPIYAFLKKMKNKFIEILLRKRENENRK